LIEAGLIEKYAPLASRLPMLRGSPGLA